MTSSEFAREVFSLIEAKIFCRPSPTEFELAYQARVAIDRIRFAIKATDQFAHHPQQLQEAGLQLLDALDRLESADRHFQIRFRKASVVERRDELENALNGQVGNGSDGAGL
jgi:hypothetical protein